jgi:hypothetical protein
MISAIAAEGVAPMFRNLQWDARDFFALSPLGSLLKCDAVHMF